MRMFALLTVFATFMSSSNVFAEETAYFTYARTNLGINNPTLECEGEGCEVAQLIFDSQTKPRGYERAFALIRLGSKYKCAKNPEIFSGFIYGLIDAVEDVRIAGANSLADQLKEDKSCCSGAVIYELTSYSNTEPLPEVKAAMSMALSYCSNKK